MSGVVLWWRCGVCLTAIVTEGQSRAAEGVHAVGGTAFAVRNPRFGIKKETAFAVPFFGGDAGI